MCKISDILMKKKDQLLESGDPLSVKFEVSDIDIISNATQLRVLKLNQTFPVEFETSKDIFDCANRIIKGDSIYRVLEFCMLRNRVLVHYVCKVFPALKKE